MTTAISISQNMNGGKLLTEQILLARLLSFRILMTWEFLICVNRLYGLFILSSIIRVMARVVSTVTVHANHRRPTDHKDAILLYLPGYSTVESWD
jgi:hypothetical protein